MDEELLSVVTSVHEFFAGKGRTLAVAESCTGGLVCHCITMLPGASVFFRAGAVTYSNASKVIMLGVSQGIIETYGVVSDSAAREMAEKSRALLQSDYALATTGNLGPEVLEGKERGLIYIAVSTPEKTASIELRLTGDRTSNKEQAALEALRFLLEQAREGEN